MFFRKMLLLLAVEWVALMVPTAAMGQPLTTYPTPYPFHQPQRLIYQLQQQYQMDRTLQQQRQNQQLQQEQLFETIRTQRQQLNQQRRQQDQQDRQELELQLQQIQQRLR